MKISSHIGALVAVSTALGLALIAFLLQGTLQYRDADRGTAADTLDLKEVEGLGEALRFFSLTADLALSGPSTYLAKQAGAQAEKLQVRLEGMRSLPLAGSFPLDQALIGESTLAVSKLLGSIMHLEGEHRLREVGLLEEVVDEELVLLRERYGRFLASVELERESRAEAALAHGGQLRVMSIIGGLLYIALVVLLWRWTSRTVIDPLEGLTREAARAEEGDQAITPLSDGPYEVRVLSRALSGLMNSLGQNQDVLEETVKARTDELLQANEDLLDEIVQRERAEEALKFNEEKKREDHKMEALGRLAGGIAHDFNNLLTAIVGYSDLSLGRMSGDDPGRENLEQIRLAGDRATVLTRQLLLLSRRQVSERVRISLGAVAFNMEKILQSMLGEKISLVLEVESELPAIEADRGQIEQVLMNLVLNARDAIVEFGTVKVQVGLEEDEEGGDRKVFLFVQDDGEGMSAEIKARMFEPYFSTKPADKGSGMGLSIVYGIIQQHDGHLRVESTLGEGTTMRVFLPASDGAPVELEPEQRRVQESRGKRRILLVEDEEVVRSLASATLKFAGYEVAEASDGEDALGVFAERSAEFDLVITDVLMPKMGGRELMQAVAQSCPEMPVLYMSGHIADDELQEEIIKDGVPFLPKPFKPSELTEKVIEVLGSQ